MNPTGPSATPANTAPAATQPTQQPAAANVPETENPLKAAEEKLDSDIQEVKQDFAAEEQKFEGFRESMNPERGIPASETSATDKATATSIDSLSPTRETQTLPAVQAPPANTLPQTVPPANTPATIEAVGEAEAEAEATGPKGAEEDLRHPNIAHGENGKPLWGGKK